MPSLADILDQLKAKADPDNFEGVPRLGGWVLGHPSRVRGEGKLHQGHAPPE